MKTDSCLFWFLGAIIWFLTWGFCLHIDHTYKINAFYVLFMIIGTIALVIILYYIIRYLYREMLRRKYMKRINYISAKYDTAFRSFLFRNKININDFTDLSNLWEIYIREDSEWEQDELKIKKENEDREKRDQEFRIEYARISEESKKISSDYRVGMMIWEKESKNYGNNPYFICNAVEEIKKLHYEHLFDDWQTKQSELSSFCQNIVKEKNLPFQNKELDVNFVKQDSFDVKKLGVLKVLHFYIHSACLEDLDFSNFPKVKRFNEILPKIESMQYVFDSNEYSQIIIFLKELACHYHKKDGKNIAVITKDSNDVNKHFHYKPFHKLFLSDEYNSILNEIDVLKSEYVLDYTTIDINSRHLVSNDVIVVFDVCADNSQVIGFCKKIITYDTESQPLIVYVSLVKDYDRLEMEKRIKKMNKYLADIAEQKEKLKQVRDSILYSVSSWDTLDGELRYTSLTKITTYSSAAELLTFDPQVIKLKDELDVFGAFSRKFIINRIKKKLLKTFGSENLKYITLVCIPASSRNTTKMRYEILSNGLCEETGMINGYDHITFLNDTKGRLLNDGDIPKDKLSFDEEFFSLKYVLLFDDIINTGQTVQVFKHKIESLGAIVVGAISVAKTKYLTNDKIPPYDGYTSYPFRDETDFDDPRYHDFF